MKFSILLLSCLMTAATMHAQTAQLPAGTKYVMSHFKSNGSGGDQRLYISISPDGLNWTALNNGNPVWQPADYDPGGDVVRDPAIIYNNGFWWVAFTSGSYGRHASFGLVKSPDLIHWTFVGEIDATIPGAPAQYGASYGPITWNPVFFRDSDGSAHVFVNINPVGAAWLTPTPAMHPYELHPTSADWSQWSAPALISLPPAETNELYVWKTGQVYNALFVDFTIGAAQTYATSNNLFTGWTTVRVLGYNSQEGGMIIPQPDGSNRLYLEPGNGVSPGGYTWAESYNQLATFTAQQPVTATVPMRNGKMTSDFPQSQFVPALRPWALTALAALFCLSAARRLRARQPVR